MVLCVGIHTLIPTHKTILQLQSATKWKEDTDYNKEDYNKDSQITCTSKSRIRTRTKLIENHKHKRNTNLLYIVCTSFERFLFLQVDELTRWSTYIKFHTKKQSVQRYNEEHKWKFDLFWGKFWNNESLRGQLACFKVFYNKNTVREKYDIFYASQSMFNSNFYKSFPTYNQIKGNCTTFRRRPIFQRKHL